VTESGRCGGGIKFLEIVLKYQRKHFCGERGTHDDMHERLQGAMPAGRTSIARRRTEGRTAAGTWTAAPAARILQLQRTLGNRRTARLLSSARPIQRLVYDSVAGALHVSPQWKDAQTVGGKRVREALSGDRSGFAEDEGLRKSIREAYGIEPSITKIVDDPNETEKMFRDTLANDADFFPTEALKIYVMDALQRKRQLGKISKDDDDKVNALLHDGKRERLLGFLHKNRGLEQHEAAVRKMAAQHFYLLDWSEAPKDFQAADRWFQSMLAKSKPVLLPPDYMDEESEVGFDLEENEEPSDEHKKLMCVLISMVYQKSASAGTTQEASKQVNELLDKLGVKKKPARYTAQRNSTLPDNNTLYGELVNRMHRAVREKGYLYDLDRDAEKVFQTAGYKRIAACNCYFNELPGAIPSSVTLQAGRTYLFTIEGHALAVRIKRDVRGTLGTDANGVLDRAGDYFEPLNETSKNYNDTALAKKVSSIWEVNEPQT